MKMKKNAIILLVLSFVTFQMNGQKTTNPEKIIGVWLSEKKDNKIEIYKQGTKYYGKLIWSVDMFESDGITSKKDTKNQDPALRKLDLKNLVILKNFSFDNGLWENGEIYDIRVGKMYKCTIKSGSNDKLLIRGYLCISLLGQTVEYIRVK